MTVNIDRHYFIFVRLKNKLIFRYLLFIETEYSSDSLPRSLYIILRKGGLDLILTFLVFFHIGRLIRDVF